MVKEGYSIGEIYQGGYSSLSRSYGDTFTGYRTSAGSLGLTTDPRSANVLQEVSSKLSTGVKQIELATVSPEIFESIPKQHLKEINRLSKLTGVDVSIHAPIVEPSGMTKEGFSEAEREATERQMIDVIDRCHDVNPQGSSPVTFHSSAGIPGEVAPKGKEPETVLVVNSESGSIHKLPLKERAFPGQEGKPSVEKELDEINKSQWSEGIRNISYYANQGENAIHEYEFLSRAAEAERAAGKELTEQEKRAESSFQMGTTFLNDSYRQLETLFETVNRSGSEQDKEILADFAQKIKSKAEQIKKTENIHENVKLRKEIIEEGIVTFNKITPPKIFKPMNEFAKEKTTKTFANVAFNSYKKFGDKAPIISIENPPIGGAFASGEELKEIVEESRNKFVEVAAKEGISESDARTQAEKLIGVTWDVGHINMLRKYGYKSEDIIKESEKVAKLVKHVHLSDNFGFEHTELPMGMGNVPLKEIMEKLGKEGFKAKKIIEAANWWQHFKTPPVQETLEAVGSAFYSTNMAPYWNQELGLQQSYSGGFGQMLPPVNYETFGAGFSQLPTELGGQRQGAEGTRMSGKPME